MTTQHIARRVALGNLFHNDNRSDSLGGSLAQPAYCRKQVAA